MSRSRFTGPFLVIILFSLNLLESVHFSRKTPSFRLLSGDVQGNSNLCSQRNGCSNRPVVIHVQD